MLTVIKNLVLCLLVLLPQLAAAQIFRSVDEQGNVTFSDTPPSSGPSEQIEVRQTNRTPAPAVIETLEPAPGAAAEEEGAAVAYSVAITSPENETTIAMGPGNFTVSAAVEPALGQGEVLQLFIDGSPSGEPQAGGTWALTNVFRGAHDLTVAVVDSKGARLAESAAVRVYVLRPSVNSPNKSRPRPPNRPTPH
ncbi:MAG: DUF4124 domain-containing protein [Halioglobus sp.]|nr:DUF4124 domain-containing protein [Halioglobus sp.]